MTPKQRFYVVARNGLGAAFVNAALNGAIGWALTRGLSEFPIWRAPGVAVDLVFTAFGITFGTCLALPLQTKRDFQRGLVTLPELTPGVAGLLGRFPSGLFRRAVVLGAVSIPLFAPPVLVALAASGQAVMGRVPFVELKAAFSAIQGGIVTPFIVLAILSDLSGHGAAAGTFRLR
jgi:hypothetical protein